ncbi:hypothetical protein BYT27DRAFT_7335124 [Phlegmacium glaucopus]|nr:hypothetical protein BYT27DRAFT_7335124 [Phlegmacium glaucopus]
MPIVDDKNPLYCPAIPAALYLKSLRGRYHKSGRSHRRLDLFQSFARTLEQSARTEDSDGGEDAIESDWILGNYYARGRKQSLARHRHVEDLPLYSPVAQGLDHRFIQEKPVNYLASAKRLESFSLKRKLSFSDLGAPPKYARSQPSFHDSSFDIEVQHEKLEYSIESSPQRAPHHSGAERTDITITTLADRLDSALPGIRLRERLLGLKYLTPEAFMDFMVENGHITRRILDIFCDSEIKRISFAFFAFNENGLNLCGHEFYSAFSRHDSFRYLSELSFSGIRVFDFDLLHIQHLPSLSILYLNQTGIGNEAVFLLVSLKRTLTHLSLANNHDINNEAVPAILLLSKLSFLSIFDTSIEMIGLRRLAETICEDDRIMDVEIPFVCEAYIDNIHSQYLDFPPPPLVTNPYACAQLSLAALKRNLEAHAACNPSIIATGTRPEMVQRLFDILKIRKLDMLVKDMLSGNDSGFENL